MLAFGILFVVLFYCFVAVCSFSSGLITVRNPSVSFSLTEMEGVVYNAQPKLNEIKSQTRIKCGTRFFVTRGLER